MLPTTPNSTSPPQREASLPTSPVWLSRRACRVHPSAEGASPVRLEYTRESARKSFDVFLSLRFCVQFFSLSRRHSFLHSIPFFSRSASVSSLFPRFSLLPAVYRSEESPRSRYERPPRPRDGRRRRLRRWHERRRRSIVVVIVGSSSLPCKPARRLCRRPPAPRRRRGRRLHAAAAAASPPAPRSARAEAAAALRRGLGGGPSGRGPRAAAAASAWGRVSRRPSRRRCRRHTSSLVS